MRGLCSSVCIFCISALKRCGMIVDRSECCWLLTREYISNNCWQHWLSRNGVELVSSRVELRVDGHAGRHLTRTNLRVSQPSSRCNGAHACHGTIGTAVFATSDIPSGCKFMSVPQRLAITEDVARARSVDSWHVIPCPADQAS